MSFLLALLIACGSSEAPAPAEAPEAAPAKEAVAPEPAAAVPAPEDEGPPDASKTEDALNRLDVNTATEEELMKAIPGFGKKMAHEFEEYRPYKSIRQFRKEIGKYAPAEKVAEYEQYVFVPIAFNDCDGATLQQIPGVDETIANSLVEARPYESGDAFAAAVGEKVNELAGKVAINWIAK